LTYPLDSKRKFLDVLKREFAPRPRDQGFSGSGQNYRRSVGEVIHAINIQGSRYGDSCSLNAGLHLTYLPLYWSDTLPNIRRIREVDCEFRCRISLTQSDHWWGYGKVETESVRNARHLIKTFAIAGEPLFERFRSVDRIVKTWSVEALESDPSMPWPFSWTHIRIALALARIHKHRHN